jgi:hypothetical protein
VPQTNPLTPLTDNLVGNLKGSNDTLTGPLLYGDATGSMSEGARGGNDTLTAESIGTGDENHTLVFGDSNFIGNAKGGNDTLIGNGDWNYLHGDAASMGTDSVGGNDLLIGNGSVNYLYGDAVFLVSNARCGNDILINHGNGYVFGDAAQMNFTSIGGNDALSGSGVLIGDAQAMLDFAKGGNDTITGSGYGDASSMYDHSVGGNDNITGGGWGDAFFMYGNTKGGDDVLVGGADGAQLNGDAYYMYDNAQGGNDRLTSGAGVDHMWGDAQFMAETAHGGADTFAFSGNFGTDYVYDFRPGEGDALEVHVANPADPSTEVTWANVGSDVVITVTGSISSGSITLVGFGGPLTYDDLHFV